MTRWSGLISRVVTEVTNRPGSMMRRAVARWRLRPVGEAVMRRRLAAAGLVFPEQTHPSVSVLIAMHGRPELTLNALVALMKTAREEPIEILLCDDQSPDGSGLFFEGVPGLRLTKNRENLGYLRSNNLLAAEARVGMGAEHVEER